MPLAVLAAAAPADRGRRCRSTHRGRCAAVRRCVRGAGGSPRSASSRRCRRPSCRRGSAPRHRAAAAGARHRCRGRSCPIRTCRGSSSRVELEWPIDTLEPLSFVLRAAARSAVGRARARGPRRRRAASAICGSSIGRRTRACCSCRRAMRDPRVLRTLLLLDLESHPAAGGHRRRHHRGRSGARPRHPVFAARARGAVAGNPGDAHRAARRAGRGDALRLAGAARHASARRVRDAPVRAAIEDCRRPLAVAPGGYGAARRPGPDRSTAAGAAPLPAAGRGSRGRRTRPPGAGGDRSARHAGRAVVQDAAGPWRTSGGWWESRCAGIATNGMSRSSDGAVCRLFQDRDTEQWFARGIAAIDASARSAIRLTSTQSSDRDVSTPTRDTRS